MAQAIVVRGAVVAPMALGYRLRGNAPGGVRTLLARGAPVTCFFDPSHGQGAEQVVWQPPAGVPRPIQSCSPCAGRVRYEQPQHNQSGGAPGYGQPAGYPQAGGSGGYPQQGYPAAPSYAEPRQMRRRHDWDDDRRGSGGGGMGGMLAAGAGGLAAGALGGWAVSEMMDDDDGGGDDGGDE